MSPEISVIMSVYNSEMFLNKAIESILNQSFQNFEFIIIDDASTDNSGEIIKGYSDKRLKTVRNEENSGLTRSLNMALKLAKGKYIARMDGDDIALPHRFEIQCRFLENNPQVDLCGTWIKFIDRDIEFRPPITDACIKAKLFRTNCIPHPSIMFRRRLIEESNFYYDESFPNSQDYEIFSRLINEITFANIPEILLLYRVHSLQISMKSITQQSDLADTIRIRNLKKLIPVLTDEELIHHLYLMNGVSDGLKNKIKFSSEWLNKLSSINEKKKVYPVIQFKKLLLEIKFELFAYQLQRLLGKDSFLYRVMGKILRFLNKPLCE